MSLSVLFNYNDSIKRSGDLRAEALSLSPFSDKVERDFKGNRIENLQDVGIMRHNFIFQFSFL